MRQFCPETILMPLKGSGRGHITASGRHCHGRDHHSQHSLRGSQCARIACRITSIWVRSHSIPLPAYASDGVPGRQDAPDDGDEMASYVERGSRRSGSRLDACRHPKTRPSVRAAGEAVGPDVALMFDINNGWREVTEVRQYVCRLCSTTPYFIGKPFSPDEVDHHGRLLKLAPVPSKRARSAITVGITKNFSTKMPRRFCRPMTSEMTGAAIRTACKATSAVHRGLIQSLAAAQQNIFLWRQM
jgi:hypothetical protein